ncbi:unnamed protein product, partial [Discosporangium mesarthrocarpum]
PPLSAPHLAPPSPSAEKGDGIQLAGRRWCKQTPPVVAGKTGTFLGGSVNRKNAPFCSSHSIANSVALTDKNTPRTGSAVHTKTPTGVVAGGGGVMATTSRGVTANKGRATTPTTITTTTTGPPTITTTKSSGSGGTGRRGVVGAAKKASLSSSSSPNPSPNPRLASSYRCPHCHRRFSAATGPVHAEICQRVINRPKG